MKFGPVPLAEAEGAILAHGTGTGAQRIGKGTVLTAAHVGALRAAGLAEVIVARLGPGDLHEDEAATRIAQALAGPGLIVDRATTGRVNLRAEAAGIVQIDAAAIAAVNRINPSITVATVPEWGRLAARGLAVTVKIIPFAAARADVERACAVAAGAQGAGAVQMRGPVIRSASLIETRVSDAVPSEKGRRAVAERLERLSVSLGPRVVVDHEVGAIAGALAAAEGDLILILTGSATSDVEDVAPAAVRASGGAVVHYGMPVDPGNLLFVGRVGARAVIGLPGCARSPALNGADWVMERVICGVALEALDIPGMGVGGLLKEIPSRPRPREG